MLSGVGARPVFVIGFMAAGKTTVGRRLAERMERQFIDLDEEIVARAGRDIPSIFRTDGEPRFRELEAQALADVATRTDAVIATGGGAPAHGENLARMKAAGVVLGLGASLDSVLARVTDPSTRPLLDPGRSERVSALYAEREGIYAQAHVTVRTDGRDIDDVVGECEERVRCHLGDVVVSLGTRSYPIHLASLDEAGPLLAELVGCRRAAVVTDANVAAAGHSARVAGSLAGHGIHVIEVTVPAGEASKRLAEVDRLASALVAGGLDRQSAIVAVGGGVVGDLAGFVAATLYRGVPVVQVPTTLLAMVDSSIGGKTGVDLAGGKNLVGAFWQPRFVLADPSTLDTLPDGELRSAFGEVLKYGLLGDEGLFVDVETHGIAVDRAAMVRRCARLKAEVVAGDETESLARVDGKSRAVLNLGHTVGHAIEAAGLASGSGPSHGAAVALGLVAAARVSARLGLAPPALEGRVAAAVRTVGLDADLRPWLRPEVLSYIAADKKRASGQVRFIALEGVGRSRVVPLAVDELVRLLTQDARQ